MPFQPRNQPLSPSLPPLDSRYSHPSLDIHFLDLPSPFYAASSSLPDRSPIISPFKPSKPRFSVTQNRYHSKPSTTAWWRPSLPGRKTRLSPVDEEGLLSQGGIGSIVDEERWKAELLRRDRRGFLEVMALFGVGVFLLAVMAVCLRMGGVKIGDGGKGIETHMEKGRMMSEMGLGPRK